MAKKIYDILPPGMAHKVEDTIKALTPDTKKKPKKRVSKQALSSKKKERRFPTKELIIGGAVIVLLLGLYLYKNLAKAEVQIWPRTDALSFQQKATLDTSAKALDIAGRVIPASHLEQQAEVSQQFPATGSASNDGKAGGTVKVYNKISPSAPFVLKAGTHLLSDSGKYFITLDKITVPAATKNSPGTVSVKVQAEQSGADYNIGASKFSVPKLSGTPYYYGIWAESTVAMAGGYTGQVKKVTADDLQNAKDTLVKKLFDQASSQISKNLTQGQVMPPGGMVKEIILSETSAKVGDIVDEFNQHVIVKVSGVVFSENDLRSFALQYAKSQLPDYKKFLEKSLKIDYSIDSVDAKSGLVRVNAQITGKSYPDIDLTGLADLLAGKTGPEIESAVAARYGDNVTKTQVSFWPFWVHQAPADAAKITTSLDFE